LLSISLIRSGEVIVFSVVFVITGELKSKKIDAVFFISVPIGKLGFKFTA